MNFAQQDINALVHMIAANLADLDKLIRTTDPDDLDLPDALICHQILGEPSYAMVKEALADKIGSALGVYETTVPGVGVVQRHQKKDRTSWHKDDLLRAVLDTKLVDKDTGEIIDETPLSKVTTVWNLPAPRVTALRARGLDPDDFCETETRPGWTLRIL